MKKILIIFVLLFYMSCRENKQVVYLDKEKIEYGNIVKNTSCLEVIQKSHLLSKTIEEFVSTDEIKLNDKITRLVFIFLTESGEVVNTHKIAVLYSDNENKIIKKYRNQFSVEESKSFNIDKITQYLVTEKDTELTNTKLLMFDIRPTDTKCYLKNDVENKIVYEILGKSRKKLVTNNDMN